MRALQCILLLLLLSLQPYCALHLPGVSLQKPEGGGGQSHDTVVRLRGGLVAGSPQPPIEASKCQVVLKGDSSKEEKKEEEWVPMCRICYDDRAEGLFAPCLCSGSMGFVHRECLRSWRACKTGDRGFTHCPVRLICLVPLHPLSSRIWHGALSARGSCLSFRLL